VPPRWPYRVIVLLRPLGRLAMIDVFAIVAIVLASLTIGPLEATPRAGLYLYAGGIIALMLVAVQISGIARGGQLR
jgi:uncharacterized paraquat-inducible protein A